MTARGAAFSMLLLFGCGSSASRAPATNAPPSMGPNVPDKDADSKPSSPDVSKARDEFDMAATQLSAASDCVTMCKALASMRKAAEHLCELTKDGGDDEKKRCDGAKDKVAAAEVKVKSTCGGCGP